MSYSATLGRFLEADPIGYPDGANRYAYEGDAPTGYVDASGLVYTRPSKEAQQLMAEIARLQQVLRNEYYRPGYVDPYRDPIYERLLRLEEELAALMPPTSSLGGTMRADGATTQPATTQPIPIRIDQGQVSDHLRDLTQKALEDIASTKRGRELCAVLNAQGRTITIKLNRHHDNRDPGDKSDVINIAPSQEDPIHVTVRGKDGKRKRIPASICRLLAHELGHAVTGTKDSGPGRMDNVNENENPIVTELGEDPRIEY
jgi:hypothetical protein